MLAAPDPAARGIVAELAVMLAADLLFGRTVAQGIGAVFATAH